MTTTRELAETAAAAALDSLRAILKTEVELRAKLRVSRSDALDFGGRVVGLQHELKEAERRSDAAFVAWRKSEEAVPR